MKLKLSEAISSWRICHRLVEGEYIAGGWTNFDVQTRQQLAEWSFPFRTVVKSRHAEDRESEDQ